MKIKKSLQKKGLYFPVFDQEYNGINPFRNGHFLIAHQHNSTDTIDLIEEKRLFRFNMDHIIYMFSKYDNILLSDEGIWYAAHFKERELWKTLQRESLRNAFKIKIIVYLRRQDCMMNAMWNQKIKKSKKRFRSMTWDDFIQADPPAVYLDYDEGLNEIAAELGEENIIVRRYGKNYFKNNNIYDDFLDIFGLSLTSDYTINIPERNSRLSANSNEIQRILNSIPSAEQQDFSFFQHLLSQVSSENPDSEKLQMFQSEEAAAFMEKYRVGNRRVMEKYFQKSEDLFKINYEKIKKWEWDSKCMSEDIIRLLGHTTLSLRQENEELHQQIAELKQSVQRQSQSISDLKSKLKHPAKTIIEKFLTI